MFNFSARNLPQSPVAQFEISDDELFVEDRQNFIQESFNSNDYSGTDYDGARLLQASPTGSKPMRSSHFTSGSSGAKKKDLIYVRKGKGSGLQVYGFDDALHSRDVS